METLENPTPEDTKINLNEPSRVLGSYGPGSVQRGLVAGVEPVVVGKEKGSLEVGVSVAKVATSSTVIEQGNNGVGGSSLIADEMQRTGGVNGGNVVKEDGFVLGENGKFGGGEMLGDRELNACGGFQFNGGDSAKKSGTLGGGASFAGDSAKKVEALRGCSSVTAEVRCLLNDVFGDNSCDGVESASEKNPTLGNEVREFNSGAQKSLGNPEEMYDSMENIDVDEEEMEALEGFEDDQEHNFAVGDLVWGKLKNRPWWPGQIYDPSCASKEVARFHRRDRILVAFFGNEMSAAWCYPFQLRPFQEYFSRISNQGNLTGEECTNFYGAVEEACNGVGRRVQLEMMCRCIPAGIRNKLAQPVTSNSGITEGVLVPEGVIGGISIAEYEPEKFLTHLRYIAQFAYEPSMFERTIYQNRLVAFYHFRGNEQIPICSDEVPASPGFVEDTSQKRVSTSENKSHQGKKQRSLTNLAASASRKRKKNKGLNSEVGGVLVADGSSSNKLASCSVEQEERHLSGSPSAMDEKKCDSAKKDAVEIKEGSKTNAFFRERKKSKYLSPPYTTLSKGSKILSSSIDSETETPQIPKSIEETPKKEPSRESSHKKKLERIALKVADVAADELLSEFYSSALDPFYLKEMQIYGFIRGLFIQFRSYRNIVDPEMFDRNLASESDKEGTSLDDTIGFPAEKTNATNHAVSECVAEEQRRKRKKQVNPEMKVSDAAKGMPTRNVQADKETSSASILTSLTLVEKMHAANRAISGDAAEGKKKKRKKEVMIGSSENKAANAANGRLSHNVETSKDTSLVEVLLNFAPGEKMHATTHPVSEGIAEGKKRKRKKQATGLSPQIKAIGAAEARPSHNVETNKVKSSDTIQLNSAPVEKMHVPNGPISEGVAEANERKGEKVALVVDPDVKAASAADGLPINNVEANKETSATLLLQFAPGSPLPTKDDLVTVFGRFGALNELGTKIMEGSGCAQVIYTKSSNAEEAFNSIQENSPFRPAMEESYMIQLGAATFMDTVHGMNSRQWLPHPSKKRGRSGSATGKGSKRKMKSPVSLPLASMREGNLPSVPVGKSAAASKLLMNSPQCLRGGSLLALPATSSKDLNSARRLQLAPVPLRAVGCASAQLSIPQFPLGETPSLPQMRQALEEMTLYMDTNRDTGEPEKLAHLEAEINKLLARIAPKVESPPPSASL